MSRAIRAIQSRGTNFVGSTHSSRTATDYHPLVTTSASPETRATPFSLLCLGALGVVFGDIGTSPLYTVQTIFDPTDPHHVQVST